MNGTPLDLRNLPCPLPVIRLQQAIGNGLPVRVVVNQAATVRDMVSYCRSHRLVCRVEAHGEAAVGESMITVEGGDG